MQVEWLCLCFALQWLENLPHADIGPAWLACRCLPADKPWKVARSKSRRSTEPEVEIFCPYGSSMQDREQQLPLAPEQHKHEQQRQAAELTFACNLAGLTADVDAMDGADSVCDCDSPQVQRVLNQIQSALAVGTCSSPAAAAGDASSGSAAATGDALELPPEVLDTIAAQLPASSAAAVTGPMQVQPAAGEAAAVPAGSAGGAAPPAQRIEALRCRLEESLGQDVMLLAYR